MSSVRPTGYANEQTDDDLEEGGKGAFGQLVLPQGHKKMVLSLISQHFRNKGSQERNDKQVDIVRGKGMLSLAPLFDTLWNFGYSVLGLTWLTVKWLNREGIDHSPSWSTWCGQNNDRRYVSTD